MGTPPRRPRLRRTAHRGLYQPRALQRTSAHEMSSRQRPAFPINGWPTQTHPRPAGLRISWPGGQRARAAAASRRRGPAQTLEHHKELSLCFLCFEGDGNRAGRALPPTAWRVCHGGTTGPDRPPCHRPNHSFKTTDSPLLAASSSTAGTPGAAASRRVRAPATSSPRQPTGGGSPGPRACRCGAAAIAMPPAAGVHVPSGRAGQAAARTL